MGSIIRNPEALTESYLPEQLLYRWNQVKMIASAIEPILESKDSKTVLLYGPSGAGKTTAARFFLGYLKDQNPSIKTTYINCWNDHSRFNFLLSLAKELGITILQGRVSGGEVFFRIEKACQKSLCTLVLDEVDQLEDKRLLYRIGSLNTGLILITNDDRALYRIDERVKSRLGPLEKVHFPAYTGQELADIVEGRAHIALRPQSLSKAQIRRIVACAGNNAHLAMESLKLAAERADAGNATKILDEHIDFAVENARRSYSTRSLGRLNDHQRVLFEIIRKGNIGAGQLHKAYREKMKEPMTERAVRNHLQKMVRYGFIKSKGEGRWRVYCSL